MIPTRPQVRFYVTQSKGENKANNYKEISTSNRAMYEYTSGDILYFKMPANTIRDLDFFLSDVNV